MENEMSAVERAIETHDVLLALRAESQGFTDFSEYTRCRALAIIARNQGRRDVLAEDRKDEIEKLCKIGKYKK